MTTPPEAHTAKLATVLANAAAAYLDERNRPSDVKTTKARLDGAAIAANALGFGRTPAEVFLVAIEYVRANPRPQAISVAFPTERKAWAEAVENSFAATLHGIR